MIKHKSTVFKTALCQIALSFLIVAFALLSIPFGIIGRARSRSAIAESAAQTTHATANKAEAAPRAALEDVELTVYYHHKLGTYDGYNMWIWDLVDGEGANYPHAFEPETITFPGYESKQWKRLVTTVHNVDVTAEQAFGVILRKTVGSNDWGFQTEDMMIDGSYIVNNKIAIYLVHAIDNTVSLSYSLEDAVSNKITSAQFTALNKVNVVTSVAVTDKSLFKIKDDDDIVVGTLDCSLEENAKIVGKTNFNIELENDMDICKSYKIVDDPADAFNADVNFSESKISVSRLYDLPSFSKFEYNGTLGAEYSATQTKFTVWAPTTKEMTLNIYDAGEGGTATTYAMTKGDHGEWSYTLSGDLNGKYYTYTVGSGAGAKEVVDPYARSGGKDGKRGMILDLQATNPEGWDAQQNPTLANYSEAVIYEAQLRDLTIHESSNVSAANRGKFLGMTEKGTENARTPLDYLKELGVTAVHFQPLFDFASVKENFTQATYNKDGEYNWGYDPLNYNMPEGSYSSNPADGAVRVKEMKQMIMALHNAGIQVIMDVVYNHVSDAASSNFEALMPGYYFRMRANGSYYNGSGCGNETASNHAMFRKFMIDSVKYWTEEYKIDGFRFDLMGLHDITTMNDLYDALQEINPDVMIYGEGWTGGTSGLPSSSQATLANASEMPNIAVFDDIIRDGLKGSVFDIADTGFVSGKKGVDTAVYVGAAGGTAHSAVNYKLLGNDKAAFASNPTQNINYVSAHDNSTLWDKLNCSVEADKNTLLAMNRLAAVSVFTSQGASFFLAGEELLRSKPTKFGNTYDNGAQLSKNDGAYYASNSYKSPDSVNAIDWNLSVANNEMVEFYKALISIKRTFPQFRIAEKTKLNSCLKIADGNTEDGITMYAVKDPASDSYAVVLMNSTESASSVPVPNGNYKVYVNGAKATADKQNPLSSFKGKRFTVGARSAVVMVADLSADEVNNWVQTKALPGAPDDGDSNLGLALGLGIGIPAAVLIAGGAVFGVMYGKKKKGKKDEASDKDEPKAGDKPDDGEAPAEKTEQEQAPAEEQPSTDKSEE